MGRQQFGTAIFMEVLTKWRQAETVWLINKKPEVAECMRGSNGSLSKWNQHHLDRTQRLLKDWTTRVWVSSISAFPQGPLRRERPPEGWVNREL